MFNFLFLYFCIANVILLFEISIYFYIFNITLTFEYSIYLFFTHIFVAILKHTIMSGIKGKSGGAREGAGRPAGVNQKAVLVKFDLDLIEFLNKQSNRNRFINDCVRKFKEENAEEK